MLRLHFRILEAGNRSRTFRAASPSPASQDVPLLRRVYINYPDLVLNFIDTVEF
jgi:hypothetical protein